MDDNIRKEPINSSNKDSNDKKFLKITDNKGYGTIEQKSSILNDENDNPSIKQQKIKTKCIIQ